MIDLFAENRLQIFTIFNVFSLFIYISHYTCTFSNYLGIQDMTSHFISQDRSF